MKIHCLTHVPFEDAACLGRWAQDRGHELAYTHLYCDEPLPTVDAVDMLAVMGGPMNIYEHEAYPWLIEEKAFIRRVIDAGKKVVGVCLGAQLIADVLGGRVAANPHKEIGWYPVTLTEEGQTNPLFCKLPRQMAVFHWHGDTFSLPPEAVRLAGSDACLNQAFFCRGRILGLQFHMEYLRESIEKMLTHCSDELVAAQFVSSSEAIREGYDQIPQTTEWLYTMMDAFEGL